LKNLQSQTADLRTRHEKEASSRNNYISKLKEEIQEIKTNSMQESKSMEQDTSSKESKYHQEHRSKDAIQTEDIQKLEQQLEDIIKQNKKAEQNLRKKKLKTEKEVENWVTKYDQEMQDKENEIQSLTVI
jgi:hypothetical protein